MDTAAPTVTVRGDVLWITLSALKPGPGEALADVSARTTALVALLDDVGVVGLSTAARAARHDMPVESGDHELAAWVWATFELDLS